MSDRAITDEAIETMLARRAARAMTTGLHARIAADVQTHPRDDRAVWRSRGRLAVAMVLAAATAAAAWATVGQRPAAPMTFAPGSLAYVRGSELFVAAEDGSNGASLTHGESPDEIVSLAFSPDRSAIAYVRGTALHVRAADGRSMWTHPGSSIFSWSPDGTGLAVARFSATGAREIELLGSDGRSQTTLALPSDFTVNFHPWIAPLPWSPDGHWIAVGACHVSIGCGIRHGQYLLVAADGSGTRALSPQDESSYLAWGPDGTIALPRWATGSVSVVSADGSLLREIDLPGDQTPAWAARGLAWSPDGTSLAIVADDLVVADGDRVTSVMSPEPGSYVRDVHWSSDGLRVIFSLTAEDSAGASLWSVASGGGAPQPLVPGVDSGPGTFDVLP